jgi:hypothetical protein
MSDSIEAMAEKLARVRALVENWESRHHTAGQIVYAPELRAILDGTDPAVEQGRRMDEFLTGLDQAHAKAARAEASENALRSEIEAAFRKHGMAAGPRAIEALVEARDKARAEAEDQRLQQVAHHASMSGTIDDLRTRLVAAQAQVAADQAAIVKYQLHITEMLKMLTAARAALLRVATAIQQQGTGASSLLEMAKCIDQVIKGKPQN